MTRSTDAGGEGLDSIPEYFCKPGITEALAKVHPVLLVRQMANEILRLRAPVSERRQSQPFLPLPWRYADAGEGTCPSTGRKYGDIYSASGVMVAESVYEDDATAILEAMGCTVGDSEDGGAK